jgi:hypothetical protein
MLSWLASLAVGAAASLWLYGWRLPRQPYHRALAAARALSVALVVALLLDAPLGVRATLAPLTALDASASWGQGRSARFAEAAARARAARDGSPLLFGDSLREGSAPAHPGDLASRVGPAVDRASALGRPLAIITDGQLDDPEALAALPAGSTVEVIPGTTGADAAVRSLDLPSSASAGDSIELRALVVSGGAPVPAVAMTARLADGTTLASGALGALGAWGEREWRVRVRVPERRDAIVIRVVAAAPGDVEVRNDTLATVLEVRTGPVAVFVSTAPDQDSRFALEFLRGALAFGVRGYVRVAPGAWREEGSLERVEESVVRQALARAPLAVLHGDTALLGAPRALTRGALALIVPPRDDPGEYFAARAESSPLAAALSGVPWDSLPPVAVGSAPVGTSWLALTARRARRYDDRPVVAGWDAPRRVVVIPARGLWRWKFRGGRSADAFAALWGGVFDWLAQGSADERAVLVASPWFREGESVSWRRGAGNDSVVVVRLRRDGAPRDTSVDLRFPASGGGAVSSPLPAGIWRASVGGGAVRFAVNASAEWVPRRPIASQAAVAGVRATGAAPSVREAVWLYALVVALLCAEWWMRRRVGLR